MGKTRDELVESIIHAMVGMIRGIHSGPGFPFGESRLGPPQARMLFLVAARGEQGISVKDLAVQMGVTPGAITQFVDLLVEKNLLRREEDPNDRRVLRIRLTELARSRFKQFRSHYFSLLSKFFDTLSDEEVEQLASLLAKIRLPSGKKECNRYEVEPG